MPCLLLVIVLSFPRLALALLFFFSNYLERAYHGLLIPLLGFIFLPLTAILYAWIVNTHRPLAGTYLLVLVLGVVVDLGLIGGGAWGRRR